MGSGIYWGAEHHKKIASFFLLIFLQISLFANADDLEFRRSSSDTLKLDTHFNSPINLNTEKLNNRFSKEILLTGFYANSIYPSHNIYQHWDINTLFPKFDKTIGKKDTIRLVLQDKDNFCNYYTPIQGIITSEYGPRHGRMHEGIDLDLNTGDGVKASFDGMVRIAKDHPSYGNVVIIRHYNGLETLYGHLSKIFVEPGDIVNAGEVIAYGGNTGRSTGSHLHFELRFKGEALNPKSLISFNKNCLVSDSIMLVREHSKYRVIPLGIMFHTVKKGDYLYRIARKYGVSISELCEINGIRRNDILRIGQKLRLEEINYAQTFKHQ